MVTPHFSVAISCRRRLIPTGGFQGMALTQNGLDSLHGTGSQDSTYSGNSLALAERYGLRSIAVPAIAAGIYGYPAAQAAAIAVAEAVAWRQQGRAPERILLVAFGADMLGHYRQALAAAR